MIGKIVETILPTQQWGLLLVGFALFERLALLGSGSPRRLTATWGLAVVLGSAGLSRLYEGDIGTSGGAQWYLPLSVLHENLFSFLALAGVLSVLDAIFMSPLIQRLYRRRAKINHSVDTPEPGPVRKEP